VKDRVAAAQAKVVKAGQKEPAGYSAGERDFENLVKRDDLDVVYIPTPWRWHVPMAVAAMEAGKHVFVEVPAASTLEDCWKLVETSERTRRHCVMLENCCYGENELMVLGMVRAGLFGELTHAEAAYIHDLRNILFDNLEGLWRRDEHFTRNGNLYPTHGLGPVAHYLDINRGDRFEALVSMSSREASLSARRDRPAGRRSRAKDTYACGDMNTSILRTARGRTVLLQHDVVTPRPYTRINHISGTKGAFRDYPARIFLDGSGKESGKPEALQEALRASALDAPAQGREQERPRRHGLRDELAASCSACARAWCPTWTSTTPRPGARPLLCPRTRSRPAAAPSPFPTSRAGAGRSRGRPSRRAEAAGARTFPARARTFLEARVSRGLEEE
jgi:predicted dehydrogenase